MRYRSLSSAMTVCRLMTMSGAVHAFGSQFLQSMSEDQAQTFPPVQRGLYSILERTNFTSIAV
ncbi:exported hypothetical protein [Rhizobium sp. EC-SD404]|nr:exported hypothetical protein [Rhizobium sp. EC-SD404]